ATRQKDLLLLKEKKAADSSNPDTTAPKIAILVKPAIPGPDINSKPYQRKKDTTPQQKELIQLEKQGKADTAVFSSNRSKLKLPGKIIAFQQTFQFLNQHPRRILTGNGMGNFSSKLALRATGLNYAGGYPKKFVYI